MIFNKINENHIYFIQLINFYKLFSNFFNLYNFNKLYLCYQFLLLLSLFLILVCYSSTLYFEFECNHFIYEIIFVQTWQYYNHFNHLFIFL